MPWMRTGDTAATYPALMALVADPSADERTVNEAFGWLTRCAILSAAHKTDYVIDVGTAYMIGGARAQELIRLCIGAGLLTSTTTSAGLPAYKLIADPEFIHMRLREEIEWERTQRSDCRNPDLTVPVRRRDGDQCRWCGVVVLWRGKTSNRSGTLDHLQPGKPAIVDTLVVACRGCNSARSRNPESWDDNHRLLPPPVAPMYGKWTAEHLSKNGWVTDSNITTDDVSAMALPTENATGSGLRPVQVTGAALPSEVESKSSLSRVSVESKSTETQLGRPPRSRIAGSGRDGTDTGSGPGSGVARDGPGSGVARDGPGSGNRRRSRRRKRKPPSAQPRPPPGAGRGW